MENFLDTDFYSFTVSQAIFEHFTNSEVIYKFIDRNKSTIYHPDEFLGNFNDGIDKICDIKPTSKDIDLLKTKGLFKDKYLEHLLNHKFDRSNIHFEIINGKFQLEVKGKWADVIHWEVPLLGLTTNLYLEDADIAPQLDRHCKNLHQYKKDMGKLKFAEFGTRRRRNFSYQDMAVSILRDAPGFLGTSNPYLASKYEVDFLGTQSHQFFQGVSGKYGVHKANAKSIDLWTQTYGYQLGMYLTDTFGTDNFIENFNEVMCIMSTGVRHDSGDPLVFADKFHKHYVKNGIDPRTKTMMFSDGLTPSRCREIDDAVQEITNMQRVYAIGTAFTNDQKLSLVMKLFNVDGVDVVKISDEPAKASGAKSAITKAKQELNIQ